MPLIREATPSDAAPIQAIYAAIVSNTVISFEIDPPTVTQIADRIAVVQKRFPWLVCEIDGQVAGYVYASAHHERAAYQWSANVSIYVHEDYHRRGIARALYTSLFALLKLQGIYNAYAGITLPNGGSVGLHESMGFEPVGIYRKVGHKFGAWHDVGWWSLVLRSHEDEPVKPLATPALMEGMEWQTALEEGRKQITAARPRSR